MVVLLTVLAFTMWSPSPIRAMQTTDEVATKIAELLDESGYVYTKHNDTVWSINRHGNYLSQFKVVVAAGPRSEEHTSELQSRLHLVCRLLLEKKKHKKTIEI